MERDDFQKLKTINELDVDEIVVSLEIEIDDYERKAKDHDDDYAIDVSVLPAVRAAFFQRIVDVIKSQQAEIRCLMED